MLQHAAYSPLSLSLGAPLIQGLSFSEHLKTVCSKWLWLSLILISMQITLIFFLDLRSPKFRLTHTSVIRLPETPYNKVTTEKSALQV